MRLTRRAGLAAGAALVVVLGIATGILPRLVGTFSGPSDVPAAASRAPGATAPTSYLELAPSLDGAPLTQTRSATVTISGAVPPELVGRPGFKARLSVTLPNGNPTKVRDVAIGTTSLFTIRNVRLAQGRNVFTATILGPDGEGIRSAAVTWILDTTKPGITLTAPVAGATVNRSTVDVEGKTQAGSLVTVRNAVTRAEASGTADAKGLFTVRLPIAVGSNTVTITVVDPAGNTSSATRTVVGGKGHLTVSLTASATRISAARFPESLVLTATALDPDGNPLPGVEVAFTLTLPGLPPFSADGVVTDASGRATFRRTVPVGTDPGIGSATAAISTGPYGDATRQIPITVVP